jgi:hypothetical protein
MRQSRRSDDGHANNSRSVPANPAISQNRHLSIIDPPAHMAQDLLQGVEKRVLLEITRLALGE